MRVGICKDIGIKHVGGQPTVKGKKIQMLINGRFGIVIGKGWDAE